MSINVDYEPMNGSTGRQRNALAAILKTLNNATREEQIFVPKALMVSAGCAMWGEVHVVIDRFIKAVEKDFNVTVISISDREYEIAVNVNKTTMKGISAIQSINATFVDRVVNRVAGIGPGATAKVDRELFAEVATLCGYSNASALANRLSEATNTEVTFEHNVATCEGEWVFKSKEPSKNFNNFAVIKTATREEATALSKVIRSVKEALGGYDVIIDDALLRTASWAVGSNSVTEFKRALSIEFRVDFELDFIKLTHTISKANGFVLDELSINPTSVARGAGWGDFA